ncbi:type IV secretion system protein VirB10 (plasmid) [Methylocystis sp. MJC1]|uniref:type IV secretion system protein VirB10 n=1 Tax=Methylocystis sp. MJC1 TaxID=2654282 RepID=UPI0013EC3845|nr:type IV secretion system protein VirB10 [Methylocystis sp. MJC1]KAF2991426.1 Type IV secretion system protein virB10 [Methylocystis sp. MJC1]MBU6529460.1 type IV secretion system protein VirB10 [Methylocystis sp. MJC1]UZX14331.1 type IV secretion system protein VirB10 [Methylocystis sp. MJC1]
MAADFEEEGRLANETVTRQSSNPNVMLGGVAVLAAAVVIGLMWYASGRKQTKPQNAGDESFATARLQPGATFDRPAQKDEPARFVIPAPPVTPPVPQPAVVVAPAAEPRPDDSEARRLEELERLRKEAEAKLEARLRSPMLAINDKEGTASVDPSARVGIEKDEEDPNRRFLRNAENDVTRARAVKHSRIDALVPQGFMIRGVLETGIQSDLPGNVRASVSEDVYSFDGRRVLIPKGTMLTGEYRSGVVRGQSRVLIIWTRMLRADGVSLMLGSYGTDNLGRSGLEGEVDKHFLDRFGNAALLTLTGGVAQFVASLGQNQNQPANQQYAFDPVTGQLIPIAGTQNSTLLSARQIGAQAASQAITRMAEEALKDEIHIPPTIYVDQGTRILVFVKRDLDFSDLYADPVKEALYELKHPNKRARRDEDTALGDPAGVLPERGGAHTGLVTKP